MINLNKITIPGGTGFDLKDVTVTVDEKQINSEAVRINQ